MGPEQLANSASMYNHAILTVVYGFLRARPLYLPNPSALSSTVRDALMSPARAWAASLSSARKIAHLTLVHRAYWGSDRMPGATVHCIMAALFALLDNVDDPANRDAFISLTAAAAAFSRQWESPKNLLRNIQNIARQRDVALPPETGAFFLDPDQPSGNSTPIKVETP